jgi:hypothetical protein
MRISDKGKWMNYTELFSKHLESSMEAFLYGLDITPPERLNLVPPKGLGDWSVMRQLYHISYYERGIALPSMQQWLGGSFIDDSDYDDDRDWLSCQASLPELIADFKAVRQSQIELLPKFSDAQWNEERETIWGLVPLRWVVSKTWQHTHEHTSNIMRIALFWDLFID